MAEIEKQKKSKLGEEIEILAGEFFTIGKGDKTLEAKWLSKRNELCAKLLSYIPLQYPSSKDIEVMEDISSDTILNALENFKLTDERNGKFLHYFNTILKREIDKSRKKASAQAQKFANNASTNGERKESDVLDLLFDRRYKIPENDLITRNYLENILGEVNTIFKNDTNRENSNVEWKRAVYTHLLYGGLRNFPLEALAKYDFANPEILQRMDAAKLSQKDVAEIFGFDKSAYNSALKTFRKLCGKSPLLEEAVKS